LRTIERAGVATLKIFEHVLPKRFKIAFLSDAINKANQDL
jgi:hypothetical protein